MTDEIKACNLRIVRLDPDGNPVGPGEPIKGVEMVRLDLTADADCAPVACPEPAYFEVTLHPCLPPRKLTRILLGLRWWQRTPKRFR